jgi:gas vesicle protein
MSENSSNDLGAFLAGFVIGGLIGAATAIILAPQSGQETRAQIAAKSEQLIHTGEAQYQHYRDTAVTYSQQYAGRANEMVAHTKEQVDAATGRVQEQARIVLDRGKSQGGAAEPTPGDPPDSSNGSTA